MSIESVMPSNHLILCHSPCSSPESFPVLGSFPMSQLFTSGGQSIGASASVLPVNIQGWFPLGSTGLISLLSKGLSKVFTRTTICSLALGLLYGFIVQLSHPYMTTRTTIALTIQTFVGQVMSLLFNMPFRFVTAFYPRSKCILILWLQSSPSVILEPKKIKSVTISTYPSSICMKWWDWMPWP